MHNLLNLASVLLDVISIVLKLVNQIVFHHYYFIEDSELLAYLENNLFPDGTVVTHTYENITSDMICKS